MSNHNKNPFYITTAISYPNGVPHIGHAYELIATDAIARFKRLDGHDVLFLTGVDEHGQKMLQTARKEGLTVQELADRNTSRFQDMAAALNSSHDDYIRTSEERHHESCQEIWNRMASNESNGESDIYKSSYAGWYSVRDEAYYAEDETEVLEDGSRVGAQGTPVEWVEEESYFFRLSAYEDKLLQYFEENPEFLAPKSRRNEIISFIKSGLKDLSISRTTFDWGVKVPGDDKHVMYVWVDALTNYITGADFPNEASEKWQKYWPADVHVIGKDITRFHTIYWPAFLMSAGLPLPKKVFGHGFLLNSGEKMSKSLGNVVDPFDLIDTYGVDSVRFYFLREVAFGQDGSYSHEAIINRVNADLANDLGNLASRALSMIAKNLEGNLGAPNAYSDADKAILELASNMLNQCREAMDKQHIHDAVGVIWHVVSEANKYFAGEEPWALKNTDIERMRTVLYVASEIIRQVAILAQPYMPESCNKLLDMLKIPQDQRQFEHLGAEFALSDETVIEKPSPVFPRIQKPAEDEKG